jgi:dTMP kinase
MPGKIIAIEGIDAAGKGTQARLLAERLRARLFSFPDYTTPVGKLIEHRLKWRWAVEVRTELEDPEEQKIRDELWTHEPEMNALVIQALMTLNRYELAPDIAATVAKGQSVVLDRYYMSGIVYGSIDGLDASYIEDNLSRFLPRADLQILIDVPVEVAASRREGRDLYEKDISGMHLRLEAFRRSWELRSYARSVAGIGPIWAVVDGVGSIEDVHRRICDVVAKAQEA